MPKESTKRKKNHSKKDDEKKNSDGVDTTKDVGKLEHKKEEILTQEELEKNKLADEAMKELIKEEDERKKKEDDLKAEKKKKKIVARSIDTLPIPSSVENVSNTNNVESQHSNASTNIVPITEPPKKEEVEELSLSQLSLTDVSMDDEWIDVNPKSNRSNTQQKSISSIKKKGSSNKNKGNGKNTLSTSSTSKKINTVPINTTTSTTISPPTETKQIDLIRPTSKEEEEEQIVKAIALSTEEQELAMASYQTYIMEEEEDIYIPLQQQQQGHAIVSHLDGLVKEDADLAYEHEQEDSQEEWEEYKGNGIRKKNRIQRDGKYTSAAFTETTSNDTNLGIVTSVGMANRYGENNCFLNVIVQGLYRLIEFRKSFCVRYVRNYSRLTNRLDTFEPRNRIRTAFFVLESLYKVFEHMGRLAGAAMAAQTAQTINKSVVGNSTSIQAGSVSLNSFRKALYQALYEREAARVELLHSSTLPTSTSQTPQGINTATTTTTQATTTTTTAALIAVLGSRAMGDAAETLEEIVTLVHESEAICEAVFASGVGSLQRTDSLTPHMIRDIRESVIRTLDPAKATAAFANRSLLTLSSNRQHMQNTTTTATTTFSADIALPLDITLPTSSALESFGILFKDISTCDICHTTAYPMTYTALQHHINTFEFVNMRRKNLRTYEQYLRTTHLSKANIQPPARFSSFVRALIENDETRPCTSENCKNNTQHGRIQLRLHRTLLRTPKFLTFTLIWATAHEEKDVVDVVLDSLDGIINLNELYHQDAPELFNFNNEEVKTDTIVSSPISGKKQRLPPLPARLRGIVSFIDAHYVAFFDISGSKSDTSSWVCFNDEKIYPISEPIVEARRLGLKPSILFYECGNIGDPFPQDHGKSFMKSSTLNIQKKSNEIQKDTLNGKNIHPPLSEEMPKKIPTTTILDFPPLDKSRSIPITNSVK